MLRARFGVATEHGATVFRTKFWARRRFKATSLGPRESVALYQFESNGKIRFLDQRYERAELSAEGVALTAEGALVADRSDANVTQDDGKGSPDAE